MAGPAEFVMAGAAKFVIAGPAQFVMAGPCAGHLWRHDATIDPLMPRLHRRLLLVALLAAAIRPAAAQKPPKQTQAAVAYQDHPRGGLSCAGCTFFRRPRSCEIVEGDISPTGWCKLFDLPD